MRRLHLSERTVAHILTALGALVIAATFTASPLGRASDSTDAPQAVAAPATIGPSDPELAVESPLTLRASSEARGGGQRSRDLDPSPTAAPTAYTADVPVPPTPTAAAAEQQPNPQLKGQVGIQVGHWKNSELPGELASLRGSTGAAGKDWREVDVNLDISRRVATLLEGLGVTVDLIPATVPIHYKADAFIAVHGDANSNTSVSGYKLARASWSKNPARDDALLNAVSSAYAATTGLRYHPGTITRNMTGYYAFNQGLQHSVDASTPAVILELGFLTTASDRKLLMEQPDRAAEGIVNGVVKYLSSR